jgi:hypothetical protein
MTGPPVEGQTEEPINLALVDLYGQNYALAFLVTRLIADHALESPDGLCAAWLGNVDTVVDSMDVTMGPGPVRDSMKMHLRHYLETAQRAFDLGDAPKEE